MSIEEKGSIRLVVLASHPIQYYAPYYRALAVKSPLDVHAIFCSRIGLDKLLDPDMGIMMSWKMDLLGGYDHEFLPESECIKTASFSEINNPSVEAALQRGRPDVVLLHGYAQITMLRALAWCRRHSVPAMMIADSSLHTGTPAISRMIKAMILPIVFSRFSAFLSIGDSNQRYYETFGVPPERIFRVPNMVDEGFWAHRHRRLEERTRLRATLGLADNDLAVLFCGKLIARKRPADLLDALATLKEMSPTPHRIRLLILGDGEQRAALEADARARALPVDFLGFVNIDKLPAYYCASDVLAHPAEVETFGVIILEAAILGLPLVLCDRVGAIGPTSIARLGRNALLHSVGDTQALAATLHRLASEAHTLAALGEASLRISEELDWRVSVAGTVAAIERCLGRKIATGGSLAETGQVAPDASVLTPKQPLMRLARF
jgi:glycosyltransferase involved in cell wall biosynthesis